MPNFARISNKNRNTCCLWTKSFLSPREQIFANNGGEKKVLRTSSARKMVGTLRMTTNMV